MQGSWPFPVVVRPLFQIECDAGVQKSFRVKISVIGFARRLKATRKKSAHMLTPRSDCSEKNMKENQVVQRNVVK